MKRTKINLQISSRWILRSGCQKKDLTHFNNQQLKAEKRYSTSGFSMVLSIFQFSYCILKVLKKTIIVTNNSVYPRFIALSHLL